MDGRVRAAGVTVVRREVAADRAVVADVTTAAFRSEDNDPPVETGLLDALRADAGWLPELSLVADADGDVIGHVVGTRGTCDGVPAVGIGPVSVRPDRQGVGIGSALLHAVLGAAEARGERLVCLLGDAGFYGRFGFVPAADLGVESPDPAWGAHFQARAFGPDHPRGAFRYAAPFHAL